MHTDHVRRDSDILIHIPGHDAVSRGLGRVDSAHAVHPDDEPCRGEGGESVSIPPGDVHARTEALLCDLTCDSTS